MALLHGVVEGHLAKVDLTGLPERLLALLLLARQELRDVGVVTLGHVLVPAFLDLILDHVIHELGLGDAPGPSGTGDGVAEVHHSSKVGIVGVQLLGAAPDGVLMISVAMIVSTSSASTSDVSPDATDLCGGGGGGEGGRREQEREGEQEEEEASKQRGVKKHVGDVADLKRNKGNLAIYSQAFFG